ncbi:MAG: DUF3822 family protein [Bacteroides sp.]|nr:DUF3822 family protein [Bacteroides sp.]
MPQGINIDFTKSKEYILSICLCADGFSFSINNPITNQILYFCQREADPSLSLVLNLKQAFKELYFLVYTYKKVNVVIVSKRFTLLPSDIFEPAQIESLFHYNQFQKENEKVLFQELKKERLVVLFGMDKTVYNLCRLYFINVNFYSQVSPLIEYFSGKSRIRHTRKIYVYLRDKAMDIYAFEKSAFQLVNSFNCSTIDDAVFYLLYIWKGLDMNQEEDELYLLGESSEKELLQKELLRFILHVKELDPAEEFSLSIGKYNNIPFGMQLIQYNESL